MQIDPSTVKRLSFVRALFRLAVEQSTIPNVTAAASILLFHDSVELLLALAAEHAQAGPPPNSFKDYWSMLDTVGVKLPHRGAMDRLNRARVNLKHHGSLPNPLDIESHRVSTHQFLLETTMMVFGCDFDQLSLVEFVQPEASRDLLSEAIQLNGDGKCGDAMGKVAVAFEVMLEDYEKRKRLPGGHSPYSFRKFQDDIARRGTRLYGLEDERTIEEMARFTRSTAECIDEIQQALRIITMGINFTRYSEFTLYAPRVYREGDKFEVGKVGSAPPIQATAREVERCIDFLIDTSFELSRSDFTLPLAPLW